MNYIEREVKYRIYSPQSLESLGERLKEIAEYLNDEIQIDYYFNSDFHDFRRLDDALRVRKTNEKIELTYKGPKVSREPKIREEITVRIDSSEKMIEILGKLGYYIKAVVKKYRKNFAYKDVIISLDEVDNLGHFIEFESPSNNDKELLELAKEMLYALNINGVIEYRSYLEMVLENDSSSH
ncbi:CYTH domain-containing protein [Sulfolobales archaeon HS-7]|nr:CYTH domain-containing protein [Sulfolobales archaeon HS-7]